MRIAHFVGHSLVRYTPGRISSYWGRYTDHEARAYALTRPGQLLFCEPLNPYGFYCCKGEPKAEAIDWVMGCDVVHCHDDVYPTRIEERFGISLKGKVLVYHAHIGNIPERYFVHRKFLWRDDVKHVAITNGYGHLFDAHTERFPSHEWGRLPDILDIFHPTYNVDPSISPDPHERKLRVCYTYSNRHESAGRVNAKRPKSHMRILDSIDGITCSYVNGRPFDESMAEKKRSHVVIEECFTPYLHLSALEGASAGKCVVTKFDARTVRETCAAAGAPVDSWPFVYTDEKKLASTLQDLNADRARVVSAGEKSRRWMEEYYSPEKLLRRYLDLYES